MLRGYSLSGRCTDRNTTYVPVNSVFRLTPKDVVWSTAGRTTFPRPQTYIRLMRREPNEQNGQAGLQPQLPWKFLDRRKTASRPHTLSIGSSFKIKYVSRLSSSFADDEWGKVTVSEKDVHPTKAVDIYELSATPPFSPDCSVDKDMACAHHEVERVESAPASMCPPMDKKVKKISVPRSKSMKEKKTTSGAKIYKRKGKGSRADVPHKENETLSSISNEFSVEEYGMKRGRARSETPEDLAGDALSHIQPELYNSDFDSILNEYLM
ncbi:hypothetical protein PFISCL1PPCAC_20060 [Pristionchus fissidentatus]|uniref:Uncharacterized protein n=1 Tax=Pristionchus fissidentatus TaxID=1538716 RepID=A0AAV5WDI9_9BILA|nr:hypothetical protein PFISCL1PPCAC_20060 [Pristionchus fissidentatus]